MLHERIGLAGALPAAGRHCCVLIEVLNGYLKSRNAKGDNSVECADPYFGGAWRGSTARCVGDDASLKLASAIQRGEGGELWREGLEMRREEVGAVVGTKVMVAG